MKNVKLILNPWSMCLMKPYDFTAFSQSLKIFWLQISLVIIASYPVPRINLILVFYSRNIHNWVEDSITESGREQQCRRHWNGRWKIFNISLFQFDRVPLSLGSLQAIVCEKKGWNVSWRWTVAKTKAIKNEWRSVTVGKERRNPLLQDDKSQRKTLTPCLRNIEVQPVDMLFPFHFPSWRFRIACGSATMTSNILEKKKFHVVSINFLAQSLERIFIQSKENKAENVILRDLKYEFLNCLAGRQGIGSDTTGSWIDDPDIDTNELVLKSVTWVKHLKSVLWYFIQLVIDVLFI